MKKLLLSLTLIFTFCTYAQEQSKEESLKAALDKIFDLAGEQDFETLAARLVYTGKDESRNLKDTYNYSDSKEANAVKRIAKKIKAFIDLSDKHEFGNIKTEQTESAINYRVVVVFSSGDQKLTTEFIFAEINDKLLLSGLE